MPKFGKFDMKKFLLIFTVFAMCLALCACGGGRVNGTSWENEWGSVVFSDDGVLTIKSEDSEQTLYYVDRKGKKDNCYVVTYKSAEDAEKDENGVFIPYYIRKKELYFNGECYGKSK